MPAMPGVSDSEGEDDNVDAPQEDHPFEAVAGLDLDDELDEGLAADAEVPMELDGEHMTAAELTSINVAEKEFAKKVCTLLAEADAAFKEGFGIKCTNTEHKSALQIMDIVRYYHTPFHSFSFCHSLQNLHQKSTTLPSCLRCLNISLWVLREI